MNGEEHIEGLLRRSPQPQPPKGLKERLIMEARSHSEKRTAPSPGTQVSTSWCRRWWPALVPAGLCVICVVVLARQQQEIRDLQTSISTLSQSLTNQSVNAPLKLQSHAAETAPVDHSPEITQLKEKASQLRMEITDLETLRAGNQRLRAELTTPPPGLSPGEIEALTKARERAERIACVNNMKQLGLAARIWAGDNQDRYPQDVVCMSNEMSTPKILVCPADHDRKQAPDFGSFTMANCSYEWFLDPPTSDADPQRVLTRCPVHGTIGLCDGSVQMGVAKEHPEWLIQRDGKLYYQPPQAQSGGN